MGTCPSGLQPTGQTAPNLKSNMTTRRLAYGLRPAVTNQHTNPLRREHPMSIEIDTITVTPDLAAHWLGSNLHNRNKKDPAIARYATDMKNGDWMFDGTPIRFDRNGVLLDGQNRLHALIEANVVLDFVVIRNLDPASQETMDTGVPRSLGDALALRGYPNSAHLGGILRKIVAWQDGHRRSVCKTGAGAVTVKAALHLVEQHPEVVTLTNRARRVYEGSGLPQSIAGMLIWVTEQIDADDADNFFGRLADGQGLIEGDPILTLRNWLQRNMNRGLRDTVEATVVLAVTIKAWNAYRRGESITVLSWKSGGARPERFPEPI